MKIVTDIEYLRKPCKDLTEAQDLDIIVETLKTEIYLGGVQRGVGLAANQIYIPYRVCLISVGIMVPLILVNPVIVKEQKPKLVREGCLSLPGVDIEIERPMYVKVKALDESRRPVKYTFTGERAQCVRHEIDHLNGILMIDYLDKGERAAIESRLRRSQS
ncbi:MAG: peptide deformylase [Candidatus Omnitrophica bacterium]|nr:peptide deformylase [Candidatus Omnitrophota bacterium]